MTNVVQFRVGHTSFEVSEELMNKVRLKMYEHNIETLAVLIGRTPSCLRSIRSGRTKWPHAKTLFALLKALELELRLYDTHAQRYL